MPLSPYCTHRQQVLLPSRQPCHWLLPPSFSLSSPPCLQSLRLSCAASISLGGQVQVFNSNEYLDICFMPVSFTHTFSLVSALQSKPPPFYSFSHLLPLSWAYSRIQQTKNNKWQVGVTLQKIFQRSPPGVPLVNYILTYVQVWLF